MKGDDRSPVFSRKLAAFAFLGLVAAALFFLLGWLLAGRAKPVQVAAPASLELRRGQNRPRTEEGVSRPQLARMAEELVRRLSGCLPPKGDIAEDWEEVRDGSGSWERVRLSGRYRSLKPFFSSGLKVFRETLQRDARLDCLAATDPVSGVFTLLLISGDRVVLIAELTSLRPPPVLMEQGGRPQIAIIIDDMGRSLKVARELAALDLPLTFAVFPHLPASRRVAELLVRQSHDVMLHLPMEPRNWPRMDPGPGALFCRMSEDEFCRVLDADLKAVPGIVGVNNHMGSRLTEDREKMKLVMRALAGTGLFFIDSRTINDTVAGREAAAAGIPVLQRDVFLDNRPEVKAILEQVGVLIAVARSRGYAVGIGHPYPETVAALGKVASLAEAAGVELVPVRELVNERGGRELAVAGGMEKKCPEPGTSVKTR